MHIFLNNNRALKCGLVTISHSYPHAQALLKTAGALGKPTAFLITDTQIKEESFLEDIDNLLNAGEVPNLYAVDEKQELLEVSCFVTFLLLSRLIPRYFNPKGIELWFLRLCWL